MNTEIWFDLYHEATRHPELVAAATWLFVVLITVFGVSRPDSRLLSMTLRLGIIAWGLLTGFFALVGLMPIGPWALGLGDASVLGRLLMLVWVVFVMSGFAVFLTTLRAVPRLLRADLKTLRVTSQHNVAHHVLGTLIFAGGVVYARLTDDVSRPDWSFTLVLVFVSLIGLTLALGFRHLVTRSSTGASKAATVEGLSSQLSTQSPAFTILFDGGCAPCRACRDWLLRSPTWTTVQLLDARDKLVAEQYGHIKGYGDELVVFDREGNVWVGPSAFVITLWLLTRWQWLAEGLGSAMLWPLTRTFFSALSKHRDWVGWVLPAEQCDDHLCHAPFRSPYR